MSDESKGNQTDPLAEVQAMGKLAEAVAGLDDDGRARVLRWAVDRFGVAVGAARLKSSGASGGGTSSESDDNGESNGGGGARRFPDIAELYASAAPEMDTDKALVAAYWFQFCEGRPEFNAQEINTALKNLGHPIKSITSAFDNLKARKPAPVMQLRKSGTTKQARKTYKLTVAGKQAVDMMIGQH
jgi:hypothetical protein